MGIVNIFSPFACILQYSPNILKKLMRDDIPEWLGKPPLRGSEAWEIWLMQWRKYARQELRDDAADNPEFDYGLLSTEERWRVNLRLTIKDNIDAGREGRHPPEVSPKSVTDLNHAAFVSWQVGRSTRTQDLDIDTTSIEQWVAKRINARRQRIAHGIRYGFLAGLGAEAAAPSWSTPDYVAAYEAAWEMGNCIAIETDPR